MQEKAEKKSRLYADIFEQLPLAIQVFELERRNDPLSFRLILGNPSGLRDTESLLGLIVGSSFSSQTSHPNISRMADDLFNILATKSCRHYNDLPMTALDGSTRYYTVRAFPISDAAVCVCSEETTARVLEAREYERIFAEKEHVLASIHSILIGVDENEIITSWNGVASDFFGVSSSSVLGRKIRDIGISWDWSLLDNAFAQCGGGVEQIRIDDLRSKNGLGEDRVLGVTVNPLRGGREIAEGFLIFGADITQKKLKQSMQAQSQKMEAIGSLAAGIAHEINTPIQYVGDNTRFIRDAFTDIQSLGRFYGDFLRRAD